MHNSDSSPIFIVGAPRSGTTLTAKILGRHPAIFMPGETHFFDDIYSRRNDLGSPDTRKGSINIASELFSLYGRYNEPRDQQRLASLVTVPELAEQIHAHCKDYEEIFSLFMTLQMRAQSRHIWGNNAPRDIFSIDDISNFYPNAKIIVCVRDPRDFLGSYKGKWRATDDREIQRLKSLYHPVITSLLWSTSMKQLGLIRDLFPRECVFISPYEHLVSSPADVTEELCKFVGVPYDASMLAVQFTNSSDGAKSTAQIFSSSVGKWRERISSEKVWICQKICAGAMAPLGYRAIKVSVNPLTLGQQFLKTPIALITALRANRHKRGPLLPYLTRRLSAVFRGT